MKRLACALIGAVVLAAPLVAAASVSGDAPADEYFGPVKYSAISIRTKIDALGRAYKARWENDASIVHDADLVAASYVAWAHKYPHDTWLAPTAYHLAQLYAVVQSATARDRARAEYAYVARTFPKTSEGRASHARLAQGFRPLVAESALHPTPSPYGSRPVAAAVKATTAPAAMPAPSSSPTAN
jgi:hypothetical protein